MLFKDLDPGRDFIFEQGRVNHSEKTVNYRKLDAESLDEFKISGNAVSSRTGVLINVVENTEVICIH